MLLDTYTVRFKVLDTVKVLDTYPIWIRSFHMSWNLVWFKVLDTNTFGLRKDELIPILTKALQELSDKNDALESRIEALEG